MDELRSLEDGKEDEWLLAARVIDAEFAATDRSMGWAAVWEMFLRRYWRGFESPFSEHEIASRAAFVRGRVMDEILSLPSSAVEREEE